MRRETLIAWRGKNEVEEELKEKAGEKGSKAARQRGSEAARPQGTKAVRCRGSKVSGALTSLDYVIHDPTRYATTVRRPLLLSILGYTDVAIFPRSRATNTSYVMVQSPWYVLRTGTPSAPCRSPAGPSPSGVLLNIPRSPYRAPTRTITTGLSSALKRTDS